MEKVNIIIKTFETESAEAEKWILHAGQDPRKSEDWLWMGFLSPLIDFNKNGKHIANVKKKNTWIEYRNICRWLDLLDLRAICIMNLKVIS